jgi:MYXO-CTERM domain-containing protein
VDDAVVRLVAPLGNCSATLVAPNLVVTARHCLAVVNRVDGLACNPDGTSANDLGLITRDFEPSEIGFSFGPGSDVDKWIEAKRFFSTGSQTVCMNDIALVELSRPIDDWPLMPLRLLRPTHVGESLTVVGYGRAEASSPGGIRRRRTGTDVLTVGPNRFDDDGGQAVRGTFVVGQGPCSGDSGGPAISEKTGAIVGVYSILGAQSCEERDARNVFVQIAEYEELVREAFDAVGESPWYEGESSPNEEGEISTGGCSVSSSRTSRTGFVLALGIAALGALVRRRQTASSG